MASARPKLKIRGNPLKAAYQSDSSFKEWQHKNKLTIFMGSSEFASALAEARNQKRLQESFRVTCDVKGQCYDPTRGSRIRVVLVPQAEENKMKELEQFLQRADSSPLQKETLCKQCRDIDVIPLILRDSCGYFLIISENDAVWILDKTGTPCNSEQCAKVEVLVSEYYKSAKRTDNVDFNGSDYRGLLSKDVRRAILEKTNIRLSISPTRHAYYLVPSIPDMDSASFEKAERLINFSRKATYSQSFLRFKAKLDRTNATFGKAATALESTGTLDQATSDELWRAAITQLNVGWEAFCTDILVELFALLREVDLGGWDVLPLPSRFTLWKDCEKIAWTSALSQLDKFVEGITKSAFDNRSIDYYLDQHVKTTADPSSPMLDRVEEFWKNLFCLKGKPTARAREKPPIALIEIYKAMERCLHVFPLKLNVGPAEFKLKIENVEAYSKLVSLAYGLRCVCAHGNLKRTLDGALDFEEFSPADIVPFPEHGNITAVKHTKDIQPVIQYLNQVRLEARSDKVVFDKELFQLVDRIIYFSARLMMNAAGDWGTAQLSNPRYYPSHFWLGMRVMPS